MSRRIQQPMRAAAQVNSYRAVYIPSIRGFFHSVKSRGMRERVEARFMEGHPFFA
jgi:hypothetical protein